MGYCCSGCSCSCCGCFCTGCGCDWCRIGCYRNLLQRNLFPPVIIITVTDCQHPPEITAAITVAVGPEFSQSLVPKLRLPPVTVGLLVVVAGEVNLQIFGCPRTRVGEGGRGDGNDTLGHAGTAGIDIIVTRTFPDFHSQLSILLSLWQIVLAANSYQF